MRGSPKYSRQHRGDTRQEHNQCIRKTKSKENFRRRFYRQVRHNVKSVRIHVTEIEDLEKTAKENRTATSIPNIRGKDFQTPSSNTLIDQPQR